MLRPITRVPCWQGLQAGFELQLTLARWLCNPATTQVTVTEPAVKALHPHLAVKDWLWSFLHPRANQIRLLDAARLVASHTQPEKQRLLDWLNITANVSAQFQNNPPQWQAPPSHLPQWASFRELMEAFYDKLDTKGLPFDANGSPTAGGGVTYKQFVEEFKARHSAQVCVVCGDHLGKAQVDHWVFKANYPILSIAPDNLLPMCHQCNEPPGKGSQPVFVLGAAGAFENWYHPHHRSGHGRVHPLYDPMKLSVFAAPVNVVDDARTSNLDKLVKLSDRWTSEFKAEYRNKQKELGQLIAAGHITSTAHDVDAELRRSLVRLVVDRPNYHVHRVLHEAALEPERLNAWLADL